MDLCQVELGLAQIKSSQVEQEFGHTLDRVYTSVNNAFYNDILSLLNENRCKQKRDDIFVNILHILHRFSYSIDVLCVLLKAKKKYF